MSAWPDRPRCIVDLTHSLPVRERSSEPPVADGFQRLRHARQRRTLSSFDHAGRSFALFAVSEGLRRSADRDGSISSANHVPPLWIARCDLRRQRLALGYIRQQRELDAPWCLAGKTGHFPDAQPALSPARARQERALPPDAESRSICLRHLQRFAPGAARLRSLAGSLQFRAAA